MVPKYDEDKKCNDAILQHVIVCKSWWDYSKEQQSTYKHNRCAALRQLADAPAVDRCKMLCSADSVQTAAHLAQLVDLPVGV